MQRDFYQAADYFKYIIEAGIADGEILRWPAPALPEQNLRSWWMTCGGVWSGESYVGRLSCLLPAQLAIHYLHVLPERAWFYTFRSWSGTEFFVVFLGCAAAAAASLLPRLLLGVPLFALLALGVVPYLKPLIGPLPDSAFSGLWQGDICLQSTPSTFGPASVATILRRNGAQTSEQAIARAAFSYEDGTEAWYLARCVRAKGFVPRFDFRRTFSSSAGVPAVVGVRLGSSGHFIAVLDISDDQVTFPRPPLGPSAGSGGLPPKANS